MKKKTWIGLVALAMLLVGSATVALAADGWKTPADIVSGLTGKTVEQVTTDRQAGKTYGAQAAAAGKLDEFQAERLKQYKLRLDAAVKDGRLTQANADKLYDAMKTRMASCDGTGTGRGLGCGSGTCGQRSGMGMGNGRGVCGGFCGVN